MSLTPAQLSLRASIGGHALHAKVDSTAHTVPARTAFLRKFEDQVDPNHLLPEDERLRRARHALQAHMKRLALASARARSKTAAVPAKPRSKGGDRAA